MLKTKFAVMLTLAAGLGLGCGGGQKSTPTTGPGAAGPAGAVEPIPQGFHTVTAALTVSDVDGAVDFYVRALGAVKVFGMAGPDGKTAHAEIKIGDSIVMIGPEMPQEGMKSPLALGDTPGSLTYYTANPDAAFDAAVAAGATAKMPMQDMFWGDRYGQVQDPFGHRWAIAARKEELTKEQLEARSAAMFGGDGGPAAKTPGKPAPSPVPAGFHTLTPGLVVVDCAQSIEFYKAAFGAEEVSRSAAPDGRILHAEIKVGDSVVMLSDAFPEMGSPKPPAQLGGSPFSLFLYVPDVDAAYARAVGANAKPAMPVTNMFWGDRWGSVMDPSGFQWGLATHVEDVPPEEMPARMKAQMEEMKKAGHTHDGHQ